MPFLPLSSFERKAMENLAGLCGIIWIIATYVQFGICQLRVGNGGAGVRCVVCLGFAVKTRRRRHCRCSGVFIVDFELISHLTLVFPLLIGYLPLCLDCNFVSVIL